MRSGSCWCGTVKFEFDAVPKASVLCYCETCQKISGSPSTVHTFVPRSAVNITEGADNIKSYTKKHIWGPDVTLFFCQTCSSALFKKVLKTPLDNLYGILTGSLNGVDGQLGADVEPPNEETWWDCRAKWMADSGVPKADSVNLARFE